MEKKSVGIIIALIIAILVIGFIFLQSFKKSGEPIDENIVEEELTYPTITPNEVTKSFYDWYLTGGNALPSENYKTNTSLTDRFKGALRVMDDKIDPFICSVDLPTEIATKPVDITETKANVVVDSTLSDVEMISFIAELDLTEDRSAWQINNVVCFVKGI